MATPLRVPRQFEVGFARIRDLGDEATHNLVEALRKAPYTYNEYTLASVVADGVDTIAATDVQEIVFALLSLYSYRDYSAATISDVAQGIAQAMEEGESGKLTLPPEERPNFESRLNELLGIDSLDIKVRAGRLSLENEHTFQEARVLTDIRPVFEPQDPRAKPEGAIVLHTLKISYLSEGEVKDFFVTLDAYAANSLLGQLERANSKAESLGEVLEATHLRYIDSE